MDRAAALPERTVTQELYALAGERSVPLNMLLELTYRCNERCLHCYLPETQGARPARPGEELTAAEWERVLSELAEAGALYLVLTGGEPLLRPDLGRILRRARELRFSVEIFTNATLLTPAIADYWAELGVFSVGISCYSASAAAHDRVTRLRGSWEATLRGARLLKERGIPVKLKTPLMKSNHAEYEALLALARELGSGSQLDPMLVPRNDGSKLPLRLGLDDAQLRAIHRNPMLEPDQDKLAFARPLDPRQPTCSAGRTSGAVGPYGAVVPCIQWMVSAGNVRDRPFGEIWRQGEILLKGRGLTAKDVKPCPDCGGPHYLHCLGLSELERADPLTPDTNSCRITAAIQDIQRGRAS